MPSSMRYPVAWSMTAIVIKNGCLIVTYMLLARLLDPAAFGLISITMVGMGLAYSFIDSGFTSVVVRQSALDQDALSSLYWFNLALGFAAAALLAAAGWWAALIFNDTRLIRLMATAGLALLIAALGQQFSAVLQRQIAFKEIAAIEVFSGLVAMAGAVFRAFSGAGPVAYFEGLVAGNFVAVLLAFYFGRRYFVPRLRFTLSDIRPLLGFGFFNTAERCIGYICFNLEKPIMGRLFSLDLLGLYTVVNQLVTRPVMFFSSALSRVAYPVYANLRNDFAKINSMYVNYAGKLALVVFPLYGFLLLFSDTVITLLFGERFLAAHAYVFPLCVLGALWSIGNPFGSYLMALNRAKIGFYFNLCAACITLAVVAIGGRYSMQSMLWIWVIAVVVLLVPAEWTIRYLLTKMSGWKYAACFLPHAVVVVGLCAAVLLVRTWILHVRSPISIALEMAVFCMAYGSYGIWVYRRSLYGKKGCA
jgi:lipopolysaccharide exporter